MPSASAAASAAAVVTLGLVFVGVFCVVPFSLLAWLAAALAAAVQPGSLAMQHCCWCTYVYVALAAVGAFVLLMLGVRVCERRRTDAHGVAANASDAGGPAPIKGWVQVRIAQLLPSPATQAVFIACCAACVFIYAAEFFGIAY